jgi:hypothetical protein
VSAHAVRDGDDPVIGEEKEAVLVVLAQEADVGQPRDLRPHAETE